jgi:hypothetical protein
LEEELIAINAGTEEDDSLYAGGIFAYKNIPKIQTAMKDWWYHTSRYHLDDQLSLPYVLRENKCSVNVIDDEYYKCKYFTFIRGKK